MIVDGRAIADELLGALKQRRVAIPGTITLGIVMAPGDPVIESFVRIKEKVAADLNIGIERHDMQEPTTEAAMREVRAMKYDDHIDGIIVQLPLPEGVDVNAVLSEIPMEKDVDGINPFTPEHNRIARAPVARAVHEVLQRTNVPIKGARIVVVGGGRLVGQPTAALMQELGAQVSFFTLNEGSIADLRDADIVIAGAGQPHFIKPEHLKNGVVLLDAGTSEIAGVIQGDADPSCAAKASVFTPVPGGIGPIAVSMIFKNIFDLAERN